ncbi:DUF6674 family protein [uncultured Oscillibacter sp.]|uniref:DUF6674 family protein n=1 Tax=uncultured Oscillibacter sp. TaxID=876091 RepID=UPI002616DE5E|nr:DUF6674 family protein [uncultured Oscillibacter sp.]
MDLEKVPAFQELLKLLNENGREDQARGLSLLAWYLDGMEHQLDSVLEELQSVKSELAQVTEQQSTKPFLVKMVETLEGKVEQARDRLVIFQNRIMECTKNAVDRFKDTGVSALDRAIAAMGVKKGLEHLEEGLKNSLVSLADTLAKAEEMGTQLRKGFRNIANAGRIAANKELDRDPKIEEGRFQSAILAPMRTVQRVLGDMRNSTLAAIGGLESLELSAEAAREAQAERAAQKPGKRLEKKPSIRQALQKNQAEIATKSVPAPDQVKKQEAAL